MSLRNFFRRSTPSRRAAESVRRGKPRTLRLEQLEDRRVMAAGWVSAIDGPGSDTVRALTGDSAGNTYVTGRFTSQPAMFGNISLASDGLGDVFVAKANADGQFQWAVKAGNPSTNDDVSGVAVDASGDVYITGRFEGTAQFGTETLTSAGSQDAFVAKLDGDNGQFLWARQLGDAGGDHGFDVAVDPQGAVIVSGAFGSSHEAFVSKFAGDGTQQWMRTVSGDISGLLATLATDAAGAIYASGRLNGTAEFPTGTLSSTVSVPLITKLDSDGQWLWARQLDQDTYGIVRTSAFAPDGQLYVAGDFEGTLSDGTPTELHSAGSTDAFVAQVDPVTGDVNWAKRAGGSELDGAYGIEIDPQGNVNVAGIFRGTAEFGPQTLVVDGDHQNAFITKLTPQGAFLDSHRVVTATANNTVIVADAHIDAAGNLYVGGWFGGGTYGGGKVQFPQGPLTGSGYTGFITKLPPAGPTKFFVVDDSTFDTPTTFPGDRTYQYLANGDLTIDNFRLTKRTAPRGVASTAAGDKLWVVDFYRDVTVYSSSGELLGSWSAVGLGSNAEPQGIAVHGNDVWIVDAKGDKVFKYKGAASRLSGSQSAAGSFSLNSGNKDASDIVTDGSSFWVTNDAAQNKVFKYSLSGSLLGSWTIDAANATPTGLTIDPTNVSNIWIVDSGTDKIYQYDAAASRTSGSQSAASVFNLAPGNGIPTGIADPPPADAMVPIERTPEVGSSGHQRNRVPGVESSSPQRNGEPGVESSSPQRNRVAGVESSSPQHSRRSRRAVAGGDSLAELANRPQPRGTVSHSLALAQQSAETAKSIGKKAREAAFAQESFWLGGM